MFENEIQFAAGAILLLLYFAFREAKISKLKETILGLTRMNRIYLHKHEDYEKQIEEQKEILYQKEKQLNKEIEDLKSSIEIITNRFINFQSCGIESTSCSCDCKKKS